MRKTRCKVRCSKLNWRRTIFKISAKSNRNTRRNRKLGKRIYENVGGNEHEGNTSLLWRYCARKRKLLEYYCESINTIEIIKEIDKHTKTEVRRKHINRLLLKSVVHICFFNYF